MKLCVSSLTTILYLKFFSVNLEENKLYINGSSMKWKSQTVEVERCLIAPHSSSFSSFPSSLASELLLRIVRSYTLLVQTQKRIQGAALTTTISELFCLSFLPPNASHSTGFQNATSGQGPDRVTGLFLCRGAASLEVCRNCVTFSVRESFTRCPTRREAVLYYDECMLRYSNRDILSTLETARPHSMSSNIGIPTC